MSLKDSIGATNIFLDATGPALGIGTTSPTELLSVNGNIWLGNGGGSGGSEMLRIWNDSGVERIHGSNNPSALAFGMGGSSSAFEAFRIDASRRLLVGVTSANANGGVLQLKSGITFPGTQVPSSDANTLDDYEEGLYTPAITCGSSGTITLSTSIDTLSYTKVGRVVFLQGRVLIASKSSPVGSFNVSLPFATQQNTGDNSYYQGIQVLTHDFDLSAGALVTFLEASTASVTAAPMYQTVDNSGWIQFPAANIKGNGQEYFYINGYYFTDA